MEPGDGLHHPWLMFSISSIISAPVLGDFLSMLRTHGLSPRFLNIPNPRNIRYRFSDIGYPISTYKDSYRLPSVRKIRLPSRPQMVSLSCAALRESPRKHPQIVRPISLTRLTVQI